MTALTQSLSNSRSRILPALLMVVIGMGVVTLTGHVQAATLHDAAHDMRHATGFPCH